MKPAPDIVRIGAVIVACVVAANALPRLGGGMCQGGLTIRAGDRWSIRFELTATAPGRGAVTPTPPAAQYRP